MRRKYMDLGIRRFRPFAEPKQVVERLLKPAADFERLLQGDANAQRFHGTEVLHLGYQPATATTTAGQVFISGRSSTFGNCWIAAMRKPVCRNARSISSGKK